ncbi:hypothetical protein D6810_03325 [Candidatus Dojkabacteria bacterium]|uniref:ATP synthase subunit b n=1 Tax=Candidatus Dojkabacteria bacterium TaxID=2099670 RepID=A0A3M0YZ05_9BACT|nr:MAG: hypothetical protein D6810_03325 [Candidatus Dojkabacteria bacterium]
MFENVLSSFGFDLRYFVFNTINFVVVALLLYKFFFKRILDVVSERQKIIEEGINNKEKYEQLIKTTEVEKDKILQNAHRVAYEYIEEKKRQAYIESSSIISDAQQKANKILQDARTSQQQLEKEFMNKLKIQGAQAVVEASKKIRGEDIEIQQ